MIPKGICKTAYLYAQGIALYLLFVTYFAMKNPP